MSSFNEFVMLSEGQEQPTQHQIQHAKYLYQKLESYQYATTVKEKRELRQTLEVLLRVLTDVPGPTCYNVFMQDEITASLI